MPGTRYSKFTAISGYFEHDNEPEGPQFRAVTTYNLGLLHRYYSPDGTLNPIEECTQWDRFMKQLDHLNREGKSKYMLFYVVRHGQGYHNVKEDEVGREDWEDHWARLDGDGSATWFDAHLTEKGKEQAAAINTFLRTSVVENGLPVPMRHYTSPLSRCLETTRIAFADLETASIKEKPETVIKEDLRERLGIHTCDRRRTRSWIHENYPDYNIDAGFTENDELWKPDRRESLDEHTLRINNLLTDIFEDNPGPVVSLSTHAGTIGALYAATGHREVRVATGVVVPVLVKADLEG
ncbi:hypothetical protein VPNG_05130 [Cytospora leucostoma]|uniref:Phosphoglycerate mutase n=1 Tax=Cytospora leucostoma TaxID=1230097 RepID=A0A423X455_9PEZI|nr:hypothetical protein VPNG_05130 [Cytospora leucostoma]